jgi:hypothetical protein
MAILQQLTAFFGSVLTRSALNTQLNAHLILRTISLYMNKHRENVPTAPRKLYFVEAVR